MINDSFLTFENSESDGNIIKDNTTELRDYFASRAPQMTDQWWSDSSGKHWVDAQASFAYAYADAMLKARKMSHTQQGK